MKFFYASSYSFIILFFATSCGGMYKNPPCDSTKTSVLKNKSSMKTLYTWSDYNVEAIDNAPINYMTSWSSGTKKIVVAEGIHNVVIKASFNRGILSSGPQMGLCDLNMTFKPGMEYITNGKIEGSKVCVWIENAKTSQVVSPIMKVPYQMIPRQTSIPIFLPAN